MLRTARLLPLTGLLTLGFDPARFHPTPPACYRASWQLPGPDFHRQATTSLRTAINHLTRSTSSLLDAQWNKIEHRLFSAISMNWRGRPLESHQVILETIRATTTTRTGLRVQAELDTGSYPTGIEVTKKQMKDLEAQVITRTSSTRTGISPSRPGTSASITTRPAPHR